jgi:hypothetical protein
MSAEERIRARNSIRRLPPGIDVRSVWSYEEDGQRSDETAIRFSKKGYVSPAFVRLASEEGEDFTLFLSPFLGKIRLVDHLAQRGGEFGSKKMSAFPRSIYTP